MELINQLSRQKRDTILQADRELIRRSIILRKQFHDLFNKYTICLTCQGYCCYAASNKFNFNDCYLYGYPLAEGLSPEFNLTYILKTSPRVIRFLFHKDKKYYPPENKCEFLSENGCLLSSASRPGICIVFICFKFLLEMNRFDAREYSYLINKNFLLQNKISYSLVKNLYLTV